MKNIYKKLLLLLAAAASLAACDSREDYIQLKCDEPEVEMLVLDAQIDSISEYSTGYLRVDVPWDGTKEVKFNFIDQYGEEISEYRVDVDVARIHSKSYFDPAYILYYGEGPLSNRSESYPFNEKYVDFKIDTLTKSIKIQSKVDKSQLLERIINETVTSESIYIKLSIKNKIGKQGYAYLHIVLGEPDKPQPVIVIKDGADKLEKIISVTDEIDTSGATIAKYEYCIDGNVHRAAGGWEIEGLNETNKGSSNLASPSGEAAYNGTYIKATSLSRINHVFQTAGEHNIYVRTQNKYGYWSNWVNKKITITEE